VIRPLILLAVLLGAAPAAADGVQGRVEEVGGDAVPGGEVDLRVTLDWEGRADAFVPARPKLPVARGGALRLGASSSSFDGQRTTWTMDATVTLPERGERWQVGPGSVVLRSGAGEAETVELPALVLGEPPAMRLVGEGIGSAFVILLLGGWLLLRDRQLRDEEATPRPFAAALAAARAAVDAEPFDPGAALEALLALRVDLGGSGEDDAAPTADELRQRLEGLRYGGEEIARATCLHWLLALGAAIEGGRR
jgi:hypothetical protein